MKSTFTHTSAIVGFYQDDDFEIAHLDPIEIEDIVRCDEIFSFNPREEQQRQLSLTSQ